MHLGVIDKLPTRRGDDCNDDERDRERETTTTTERMEPTTPLQLPASVERKLHLRDLARKRQRRARILKDAAAVMREKAAAVVKAVDDDDEVALSLRLERAAALRSSVLEMRTKRARELSFENIEKARQRRTRARIKQCFFEAARTAREWLARERRTSEIRELRQKAAAKNARVHSVRDAVRARASEERTVRVQALESRLESAALRRDDNLRRAAAALLPSSPARGGSVSPKARARGDASSAARVIQRFWRSRGDSRALEAFASAVPAAFLDGARLAVSRDVVAAGDDAAPEGDDLLLFRKFDLSRRVVQSPRTIRAASALLLRVQDRSQTSALGAPRSEKSPCVARPFLAAFMVVLHPEIAMSRQEQPMEAVLQREARAVLTGVFDFLSAGRVSASAAEDFCANLRAYRTTLECWKRGDARALESDLIKMAADLTASAVAKCGGPDFGAPHVRMSPDLSALVEALERDTRILVTKVRGLTGEEGERKMRQAIREKLSAPQTITTTIPEDGAASGAQPTKPGGEEVEEGEADEARNLEMAEGAMRQAMRDLIRDGIARGRYDHVLLLWEKVRERLMRLSGRAESERTKTMAAVDYEYAAELVESKAMDNSILADMIELASRRISELGAEAYEEETLEWGVCVAQEMRKSPEHTGEILALFFEDANTLLTRIEAGVAATLLCRAFEEELGKREDAVI